MGSRGACFPVRVLAILAVLALVAFWPTSAQADAGIPMLTLVWLLSWMAFVPIVLIEAYLAWRMLDMSFGDAVKLSAKANAWSIRRHISTACA